MVGCSQPIESNLHRHLTEHLNAEVVLRTITDLDVAMQWLASTFLYVRARKNPRHYDLNVGLSKEQIDKKLLEICQIDLNKLVKVGMLTIDQNIVITPTVVGEIMAKFYVAFETMKLFTQISGTEILIQILDLISRCQEFSEIRLRVNDKKTLNYLNKNSKKNTIRFPLNGKINTWNMKVNCVIQAILGNLDISDHSILAESFTIMRNGERITKCLVEYLETKKTNNFSALLYSILLCKCFQAKLWENSPYITKQLSGIGSVMSHQLANAGKTTFRKILESNPRDLEMIIKRKHPMGNTLIEEVQRIPVYEMALDKINDGKRMKLTIELKNPDDLLEKSTVNVNSTMILIVGNVLNEILAYEKYKHSYMIKNNVITKVIEVDSVCPEVAAHFISSDWGTITPTLNPIFQKEKPKSEQKVTKKPRREVKSSKSEVKIKPSNKGNQKNKDRKGKVDKKNKKASGEKLVTDVEQKETNTNGVTDDKTIDIGVCVSEDARQLRNEELVRPKDQSPSGSVLIDENENPPEAIEETNDEDDDVLDRVSETSGASLFSDQLSSAVFAEHMDKISEEVEKAMQKERNEEEDGVQEERNGGSPLQNIEDPKPIIDFDDKLSKKSLLYYSYKKKEGAGKRQKLADFKFPNKRKITHRAIIENQPDSTQGENFYAITEMLEPASSNMNRKCSAKAFPNNETRSRDERSAENAQKSITWRSPLVFSPAVKYSPKLSFQDRYSREEAEVDNHNNNNDTTLETSVSSKGTNNIMVNVQKTPSQRNKIQIISRSRGTKFALCDKDYTEENQQDETGIQESSKEDALDICSTSFLEKLGIPRMTTRHTRKHDSSPAADYYSQLLSFPIHSQKEKKNISIASEKK
ncbi:hypothetical protein NQ317_008700 [Molorchus minor]|uniref:DNA 3'-5' helicase n=1 Tax=Molorchus minor TaxID=1323400 RepID=A0ABQ9K073_9CUCU|nr:hypothetical protein NQ317_008700 [Molorchus minor]